MPIPLTISIQSSLFFVIVLSMFFIVLSRKSDLFVIKTDVLFILSVYHNKREMSKSLFADLVLYIESKIYDMV